MKNNNEYYYNREINLNLMDLFFYCIGRKISLLILVVGMTILGGIVGLYSGMKSGGNTKEDIQNYAISSSVKSNMDSAYRYQQLYDKQLEYTENSIYMNLDFSQVYSGSLKYFVNAGTNTAYYGTQFADLMNDTEILEGLKNVVGCTEDSYVREVAGVSTAYPTATAADGSTVVKTDSMAVVFWFYAADEATCQAMVDVVKSKAENLVTAFAAEGSGYSFMNGGESVTLQMNTIIRDQQAENSNLLASYATSLAKYTDNFSGKQRDYYDVVYLGKDVVAASSGVSVKKILGIMLCYALLGCVLWLCYGLVNYLLDRHVKLAEEMTDRYGLRLIGRYCPEEIKNSKINSLYEKMRSARVGCCNDENYFISVLSLLEEDLCLIGDQNDSIVSKLGEEISSKSNHIAYNHFMQSDCVSMQKAKEAGKVVLLVHRRVNTYMEILRELEICSLQNITVIGVIMIE